MITWQLPNLPLITDWLHFSVSLGTDVAITQNTLTPSDNHEKDQHYSFSRRLEGYQTHQLTSVSLTAEKLWLQTPNMTSGFLNCGYVRLGITPRYRKGIVKLKVWGPWRDGWPNIFSKRYVSESKPSSKDTMVLAVHDRSQWIRIREILHGRRLKKVVLQTIVF